MLTWLWLLQWSETYSLLLVSILLLVVIFFMNSHHPAHLPPMPERPLPFFGHAIKLRADIRGVINSWSRRCGHIYSMYVGRQLYVVLGSHDVMKEAFLKQADVFSDRPNIFVNDHGMGYKGILFNSGEMWKEQRAVTVSILKTLGMGKRCVADDISEEVKSYLSDVQNLGGTPVDVKKATSRFVFNVIANIVLGKRFEADDPEFFKLSRFVEEGNRLVAITGMVSAHPWLRFVPGNEGSYFLRFSLEADKLVINRFINPALKDLKHTQNDTFIGRYLQEMQTKTRCGKSTTMDISNLSRVVCDLLAAGSESITDTITWFWLYVLHNRHVLAKIQAEIDDVIGRERLPSIWDKAKLPFLNATILETQRRASVLAFGAFRSNTQTATLAGYTIPKGTVVLPNLDRVLLDEDTWGDPLNFRPERFLNEDGGLSKIKDEFVPFSFGRRVCLGESLAKTELFLFLSATCQKFDILPEEDGHLPHFKEVFGAAVGPNPFKVKFVSRKM